MTRSRQLHAAIAYTGSTVSGRLWLGTSVTHVASVNALLRPLVRLLRCGAGAELSFGTIANALAALQIRELRKIVLSTWGSGLVGLRTEHQRGSTTRCGLEVTGEYCVCACVIKCVCACVCMPVGLSVWFGLCLNGAQEMSSDGDGQCCFLCCTKMWRVLCLLLILLYLYL